MYKYRVLGLLAALDILSCGQPFLQSRQASAPPFAPPASAREIEEIHIAHTSCFGVCPVYRILLRRSQASVYEGGPNAVMQGRYEALVDSITFQRLAQLLLDHHFFALDSILGPIHVDHPSIRVAAVLVDSRQKHVMAQAPPFFFQQIASSLDSVGSRLQWHPAAP
jgi:Domain of unknown function (DUF6438)